jgi:Mn-dependent DtxR family transcriptional regulator
MSEEELKYKVLTIVEIAEESKLTTGQIAERLKADKHLVEEAVKKLVEEGGLQYYCEGSVTYVRLPEKK